MAEKEIVAAILAAGMLAPLPAPTRGHNGAVGEEDQARLMLGMLHAVGLYRSVLEGLTARTEIAAEHFGTAATAVRLSAERGRIAPPNGGD
jgi:hypothetical protein